MKGIIKVGNLKIGEGIPKICVPIVNSTKEEILQAAKLIKESEADFVEWRADYFENINQWEQVENTLKELNIVLSGMPILFTIRSWKEGGNLKVSPKAYRELNSKVIKSELIDFIDIEFSQQEGLVKDLIKEARAYRVHTITSKHDFEKTPEKKELLKTMCEMQKLGGDIVKVAVMPKEKKDVLVLLEATEEMVRLYADRPLITMSMANMGVISRIVGEAFGSDVTFGTIGEQSAPGQIPVARLRKLLELFHESFSFNSKEDN